METMTSTSEQLPEDQPISGLDEPGDPQTGDEEDGEDGDGEDSGADEGETVSTAADA